MDSFLKCDCRTIVPNCSARKEQLRQLFYNSWFCCFLARIFVAEVAKTSGDMSKKSRSLGDFGYIWLRPHAASFYIGHECINLS